MKRILIFLCVLIIGVMFAACAADEEIYIDQFWVLTSKATVHSTPNSLSRVLATLKYGDKVAGRDVKARASTPPEWLEIRLGPRNYGFIERSRISDKAATDELNALIEGVKNEQVQATGTTGKKAPLRLGPARNARLIEILKEPQNAEIFDRVVTAREEKDWPKKEVWYKVRLEDGRVGYVYTMNLTFTPPPEISVYTQIRRTVAWRPLDEKKDEETGFSGRDYITAYVPFGADVGADFNRVEVYMYDTKKGQYSTAFAKSGLKGMLPLRVMDAEGGRKIFQIRLLAKDKTDKVTVQEYSFPSPIRLVKEYEEDLK